VTWILFEMACDRYLLLICINWTPTMECT